MHPHFSSAVPNSRHLLRPSCQGVVKTAEDFHNLLVPLLFPHGTAYSSRPRIICFVSYVAFSNSEIRFNSSFLSVFGSFTLHHNTEVL